MKLILSGLCCGLCLTSNAFGFQAAGDSFEQRLLKLEQENAELKQNMEAMSVQMEAVEFRDIMPAVGESLYGMGPAASKVYQKDQGLSIGGYGEAIYNNPSGAELASADFLRAILYVGYKFDDDWVFNTEIEVEHSNEIALEFAYLEYLGWDDINVRAGMLLIPMGYVNELHEPTTFRGPSRPQLEQRILPSTWRENGLGVLGSVDNFNYKLYAVSGMRAYATDSSSPGFTAAGPRNGRQKGNRALSEDLAVVGRLDYVADMGLEVGVSMYHGASGQLAAMPQVKTTIFDLHAQYKKGGLRMRGLYAQANVENTVALSAANSAATGSNVAVAKEQVGWYLEAGYDVMNVVAPTSSHQVIPFVRYEDVDSQAKVDPSLQKDPTQADTIITVGIDWKPIESIVFKAAYLDWDKGTDALELSIGYVF